MLLVGCAKAKLLAEKLDGLEINHVMFEVVKQVALSLTVNHNAKDDKTAKGMVKEFVKTIPELNNLFLSIQIVDENGKLI